MLELLTYENRRKGGGDVHTSPAALLLIAMAERVPAQRRAMLPASLSVLNKMQLANGFCLIDLSVIITLPFSVIYPLFFSRRVRALVRCAHVL